MWEQIDGPPEGVATFEDSTLYNSTVDFTSFLTGSYTLRWTVTNGACDAVSDELIIDLGRIQFFNAFSPNGDGINDEFIINLSGLTGAKLIILDRWGREVITLEVTAEEGDQLKWDGTNGTDPVPEGTYFYIFSQDGRPEVYKNYIELRR